MKYLIQLICVFGLTISCYSQQNEINKPNYQITLSNSIHYTDTSFTDLPGNGFLIDIGDEILAVTCKHALWLNRPKGMETVDFSGRLKEWKMIVPRDPSQYIVLGDLINVDKNEIIGERNTDKDYLVFKIKANYSEIKPLKLSPKAAQQGDTLYQVGCTYKTKQSDVQKLQAIAFGYAGPALYINSLVRQNNAGLSGSPVINTNNELVGIVSSWRFDFESQNWYEAPCSTDYLWEILYTYWLNKNMKEKNINTFREFLSNYKALNTTMPEMSSHLYTELFFTDWLTSKGFKYASPEKFNTWASGVLKETGINIKADRYMKSLLVFDKWKEDFTKANKDINALEQMLKDAVVSIPGLMNFCEYSQELTALGKHDESIRLLLFADEKIQHAGQLYAYLGDAYRAKGDKQLAKEAYLKCLQTYPEYPMATAGLEMLED